MYVSLYMLLGTVLFMIFLSEIESDRLNIKIASDNMQGKAITLGAEKRHSRQIISQF